MATAVEAFPGFRREAIEFLSELAANNERAWFQARKRDYERLLKEPMEALCRSLAERFEARAIPLLSDPARSPFRIYRDVRFSKDKSPYKTYVSASFPWVGDRPAAPDGPAVPRHSGGGGYFHLSPGDVYVGGGMWHADPRWLAVWRAAIVTQPARIHRMLEDPAFLRELGTVSGERLKRVPTGFAADHPDAELLKLKEVTFGRRLSDDEALSPGLPDTIALALGTAVPLMRFMADLEVA